jgi:hypothetical protein
MKTFKELCSLLAKAEDGKSEANIGDVRQLMQKLGLLIKNDKEWLDYLYSYSLKVRPERSANLYSYSLKVRPERHAMPCGKKKPKKPKK